MRQKRAEEMLKGQLAAAIVAEPTRAIAKAPAPLPFPVSANPQPDERALGSFVSIEIAKYREPKGQEYWSPWFSVIRACKAHPAFADLNGQVSWERIELLHAHGFLDPETWKAGDRRIRSGEFDMPVAWADAWDRAKCAAGEDLITAAVRLADLKAIQAPPNRGPHYERFLGAILAYADLAEKDEVAIPEEKWGAALGVSHRTISSFRRWAEGDGAITKIQEHNHGAGRATIFRVLRDRLRWRLGEAPEGVTSNRD